MARRKQAEDSLDLLLDTITNTFGSILFLTMLVALLLRTTGTPTTTESAVAHANASQPLSAQDVEQRKARADELNHEIAVLTAALQANPPDDPEHSQIQSAIIAATTETRERLEQDAALTTGIAEDQRRIAEVSAGSQQLEAELTAAREAAAHQADRKQRAEQEAAELARSAIERDRPDEASGTVETTVVPVLEPLTPGGRRQLGLYVRFGRVYVMHRWGPNGERLGPNPDHFVITTRPDGSQAARARPEAGFVVNDTTARRALTDVLVPFPPQGWVVGLVVNQDSFAQFQRIKQVLIELGYQYEPIPAATGQSISDSGGTGRAQ